MRCVADAAASGPQRESFCSSPPRASPSSPGECPRPSECSLAAPTRLGARQRQGVGEYVREPAGGAEGSAAVKAGRGVGVRRRGGRLVGAGGV